MGIFCANEGITYNLKSEAKMAKNMSIFLLLCRAKKKFKEMGFQLEKCPKVQKIEWSAYFGEIRKKIRVIFQ